MVRVHPTNGCMAKVLTIMEDIHQNLSSKWGERERENKPFERIHDLEQQCIQKWEVAIHQVSDLFDCQLQLDY